jgi:hypothetical protein
VSKQHSPEISPAQVTGLLTLLAFVSGLVLLVWTFTHPSARGRSALIVVLIGILLGLLWWLSRESVMSGARNWVQLLSFVGIVVAIFGAYENFLTPFSPSFLVDAFLYHLGPKPYTYEGTFDMTLWLSISNSGASAGELDQLALKVQFPKGACVLQPVMFASSADVIKSVYKGAEVVPFDGPFTKLFIPGKAQINKAIVFRPLNWNPNFVEPGTFRLSLFARFGDGKTQLLTDRLPLVINEQQVNDWKSGKPVSPNLQLVQDLDWFKTLTSDPKW